LKYTLCFTGGRNKAQTVAKITAEKEFNTKQGNFISLYQGTVITAETCRFVISLSRMPSYVSIIAVCHLCGPLVLSISDLLIMIWA
jgi:hypothetical protein